MAISPTRPRLAQPSIRRWIARTLSFVVRASVSILVVEMSAALVVMAEAEKTVTPDLVTALSPYMREHIRRFGQYALDMDNVPGPLDPKPLPFDPAL